jgi:hypothetical protein
MTFCCAQAFYKGLECPGCRPEELFVPDQYGRTLFDFDILNLHMQSSSIMGRPIAFRRSITIPGFSRLWIGPGVIIGETYHKKMALAELNVYFRRFGGEFIFFPLGQRKIDSMV